MTDNNALAQELEPCPFCGHTSVRIESTRHQHPPYHWAQCPMCLASSSHYSTKESAKAAWNSRKGGSNV